MDKLARICSLPVDETFNYITRGSKNNSFYRKRDDMEVLYRARFKISRET